MMNKDEEIILYKFSCTGYKDDNIECHVQPVKAKVARDYVGTVLSYDIGYQVIHPKKLNEIVPQSHIMWSLDDDMNKYLIKLIIYEYMKIFYASHRINNIKKEITDNCDNVPLIDVMIYKRILNSVYGVSGEHRCDPYKLFIGSIYGKFGDKENIPGIDITEGISADYNNVLIDIGVAHFNPFTIDINDHIKSPKNTDM